MKHIGALVLKFVIVAVILQLILRSMTMLTVGRIIFISACITVLSYLIGDLGILPRSNNTVATVADIGLSLVTLLVFSFIYRYASISFVDALVASVGVGVGEWIFHKFVTKSIFPAHESR